MTTRYKTNGEHHVRSAAARASKLMPSNGAVDGLVRAMADARGRPIRILTEDLGPGEPSGLWIATERCDWIVVPNGIGSAQRMAIICHELAHMLLEHISLDDESDVDALIRLIAPHVDPEVARRFLPRFNYRTDLEAEAETLGTLLVTKLAHRAQRWRLTRDAVSDRLR